MPSPSIEEIEVNEILRKETGVTKFYKQGSVLTLMIGENVLLQFDIDKNKVQKTKQNLEDAAYEINFDLVTLAKLKLILAKDYSEFLKLPEQEEANKDSIIKQYNVFKYSTNIPLAEQIKLNEDYVFLQIVDDKPVISYSIDLSISKHIILYPRGQTPINDFEYKNEDEINQIIVVAKTKTIDDLYRWSKSIWEKFVVATPEQIVLLTADSIFTFFQDAFVTTHYTMLVARVGSGKGAILITFTYLGYRVILGGNMSGASILDLLGSLERGQVVIAEDELNNLKNDSDKWRLYTIGYDAFGLTTKTLDGSTSKRAVSYYPAFGYKIFGAENSLDTTGLEGLIDRTFQTKLLKGRPRYYVKNLRKPKLSPEYKTLLSEITYFRQVMLIYRLLRANDLFEEVKTNIDGRPLELTGPIIDLFSALSKDKTTLKNEILPVLSSFLRQKNEISENSLDDIIFTAVKELSSNSDYYIKDNKEIFVVPNQDLHRKIRDASDGFDLSPGKFYSPILGEVHEKGILSYCRDKLHAISSKVGSGTEQSRAHLFNKKTIDSLESSFKVVTEISLLDGDNDDETEGRKNGSTANKENKLTKNEPAASDISLNKLQESNIDIENIINSNQHGTIGYAKNDNNSFQNAFLAPSQGQFSVSPSQTPKLTIKQVLGVYVAIDLEWSEVDNTVEAVSFVNSDGKSEVKFRNRDFGDSEVDLLNYIMAKLLDYDWSIGWNTQGNSSNAGSTKTCDLSILHERCEANKIKSIVKLRDKGLPYLIGKQHINLLNVYSKAMVKDGFYHSAYRTNKLDEVSKALLGRGKYKNYSGKISKTYQSMNKWNIHLEIPN